jgi:hypothetical protein
MSNATPHDILRVFPGLAEHAVLELIDAKITTAELDAAMLSLQGDDEATIEFRRRDSDRLEHLLGILSESGIDPDDASER